MILHRSSNGHTKSMSWNVMSFEIKNIFKKKKSVHATCMVCFSHKFVRSQKCVCTLTYAKIIEKYES